MKFIQAIVATIVLFGHSSAELTPDALLAKLTDEQRAEFSVFDEKVKSVQGPYYDWICALACFLTPQCRFDPHQHWSYCKYNKRPQVCFGLYEVPGDFLCFQPNNPYCLERFPLRCGSYLEKGTEALSDGTQ